jgi:hypothetical protein
MLEGMRTARHAENTGWYPAGSRDGASGLCDNGSMAVGRTERRREREPRVVGIFGEEQASAALDLLDIFELAWHDCYGEVTPPPGVIEDMFTLSDATIGGLIQAALLAVTDWRDLKVAAEERRTRI